MVVGLTIIPILHPFLEAPARQALRDKETLVAAVPVMVVGEMLEKRAGAAAVLVLLVVMVLV